ncbi:TolC family protein [Singulisphaera sp. PoT]|uniref:TolC family protein n=1 Tax=Singulisphaera sp. PoT TaxID=3411797 RepID=UPI003BF4EBE6
MSAQEELQRGERFRCARRLMAASVLLLLLVGCTRRYYRDFADRDVYRIENDRMTDWRWELPPRPVEANPHSRMGDAQDPNHEPIPPDDPGARPYQVTAGRPHEFHGWSKRGSAPVEDLSWLKYIPRSDDGAILIDGPTAMQVALMNNREYQFNVEDVYLQALQLTLVRFSFFPQIYSNQTTQYNRIGAGKTGVNQLQLVTQNGLSWMFYSGAQLLVNFANNLVFEYNGRNFQTINSGLAISLTQPLLQGAWARNVTQPLSLVERQTLYTIRNFARYRRQFYVDTVTDYLNLLNQLQQVRNTEYQVEQLRLSLDENEALVLAGRVDPLQRDNVAQQYQQSRSSLLSLQASYQTSLDLFRFNRLGLPTDFPVKLDETLLKKFELNDPKLDELRKANKNLYLALLQHNEAPDKSVLSDAASDLLGEFKDLERLSVDLAGELTKWKARIEEDKKTVGTGPGPLDQDERDSLNRQIDLSKSLSVSYDESKVSLGKNLTKIQDFIDNLEKIDEDEAWETLLQELATREFNARFTELFVIQTQIRIHLIEVNPMDLTLDQAIEVALANRLDLMNSLAQVTDAWRNVEYAGNQLLAGVNLFYNGQLNSAPGSLSVVQLDAHASRHSVGIQFNAPINRRIQRNQYRSDQIQYQRARRSYMQNHDLIVQQIRADIRELNLNRRQFDITRLALLIAVRQVDLAEYNARSSTGATSGAGQNSGNNLVLAQGSLLQNKNSLIGQWIQYEVTRMGLFRDFDVMNIDALGVWTNDDRVPTINGGPVPTTPDPLRPPTESLLPPPAPDGNRSPFAP